MKFKLNHFRLQSLIMAPLSNCAQIKHFMIASLDCIFPLKKSRSIRIMIILISKRSHQDSLLVACICFVRSGNMFSLLIILENIYDLFQIRLSKWLLKSFFDELKIGVITFLIIINQCQGSLRRIWADKCICRHGIDSNLSNFESFFFSAMLLWNHALSI